MYDTWILDHNIFLLCLLSIKAQIRMKSGNITWKIWSDGWINKCWFNFLQILNKFFLNLTHVFHKLNSFHIDNMKKVVNFIVEKICIFNFEIHESMHFCPLICIVDTLYTLCTVATFLCCHNYICTYYT